MDLKKLINIASLDLRYNNSITDNELNNFLNKNVNIIREKN